MTYWVYPGLLLSSIAICVCLLLMNVFICLSAYRGCTLTASHFVVRRKARTRRSTIKRELRVSSPPATSGSARPSGWIPALASCRKFAGGCRCPHALAPPKPASCVAVVIILKEDTHQFIDYLIHSFGYSLIHFHARLVKKKRILDISAYQLHNLKCIKSIIAFQGFYCLRILFVITENFLIQL